jgi:hypothetical protein
MYCVTCRKPIDGLAPASESLIAPVSAAAMLASVLWSPAGERVPTRKPNVDSFVLLASATLEASSAFVAAPRDVLNATAQFSQHSGKRARYCDALGYAA